MNVAVDRFSWEARTKAHPESDPQLDPSLERLLARIRLRAARRAAWLRKLWSEEGEPGGERMVTHSEIDTHLADRDHPAAEAEWLANEESVAPLNEQLAEVEGAMEADLDSPLAQLTQIFGLSEPEADVLQACLAVAVDPTLARIYAYLNDHAGRGYVTEDLVARLFGHGRGAVLPADSPLRRWKLVWERETAPGEPPQLHCHPLVRDRIQSRAGMDPQLSGIAEQIPPLDPLESWPVEETAGFIERILDSEPPGKARILLYGPPGSGRRTMAATVCARLGLPLLALDTDRIPNDRWETVWLHAQRQAYLDRTALAWCGEAASRRVPRTVPAFPVQFILFEAGGRAPADPAAADHRIELSAPDRDERRRLWQRLVPAAVSWPGHELETLVDRHWVLPGEIAAVARKRVGDPEQAGAAIREGRRDRLGHLAQPVECSFTWDDLVVPDRVRAVLEDLAFEAADRAAFWERPEARRLFPQGRGLLALFSGPPGTGKTMAAQMIAAELGTDLFRIDLSSVVSKYVGETSQNLERILSRARHMDAVLLFDEADALFGKRTEVKDAHDRFANTDTGYLLQAVEDYPGVAILATNKKSNVDPAFLRRLRYVVELPRPDGEQRLAIWRKLTRELTDADAAHTHNGDGRNVDEGLNSLATELELTGAQIKYAALTAVFAARREGRPLALRHLLCGIDRELMKEGRALSTRERQRINGHG